MGGDGVGCVGGQVGWGGEKGEEGGSAEHWRFLDILCKLTACVFTY